MNEAQTKGWIAWELFANGAARLELRVWQPDTPVLPYRRTVAGFENVQEAPTLSPQATIAFR
jgi:hypothetical protein